MESSLQKYLQRIWRVPLLDEAEERALAVRWREHGDRRALDKLATSHLRLVVKIASRYRGYGLAAADLISEGTVGLMRAASRFDPDHGARFASYAAWWIKAAIHAYVLRSWSLVSVTTTAAQRKLFFNLRNLKARIGAINDGDMSTEDVERIAATLEVSPGDVVVMNRRLAGADLSLNTPVNGAEDGHEHQDLLADESDDQEVELAHSQSARLGHRLLSNAVADLGPRERQIFIERRLREEPRTLAELASLHGVSPERVRQIEIRALAKIEKMVRDNIGISPAPRPDGPDRAGHGSPRPSSRVDHGPADRSLASFGSLHQRLTTGLPQAAG